MALLNVHGRWVNTDKPGGAVFFVGGGTVAFNGIGASDNNSGLRPEQPLATIAQGMTQCTAGRGDTVVLLPGSVTITAAIAITKADVTLQGYTCTGPQTRNPSLITCATNSVIMLDIDAPNVTIKDLTLDHNATTAAVALVDVGSTTASPDLLLQNLFIDMEGSGTTTDGINIQGDTVSTGVVIEGCTIHDFDQEGIIIEAGNDESTIRNCRIYDGVTANEGRYGIQTVSDGSLIENCTIRTAAAAGACINAKIPLLAQIRDCHLAAHAANTIGILADALTTMFVTHCFINVAAAGNIIDYTTSATVPSSSIAWEAIQATDPTIGVLTTATVGGL